MYPIFISNLEKNITNIFLYVDGYTTTLQICYLDPIFHS